MVLRLRSAAFSLTAAALVFLLPPLFVAGVLLSMSSGDPAQLDRAEAEPLLVVDAQIR